ncbi:ankyrin repeat protein [Histoplasma capsulatum H143]|uniref:Ankyrin repeat protein n=1 Tax=Ajellomyces capsulatus (strain H143) TaxID=544712 RepID=C6H5C1_AJECH|nr:ankyrin repeat protein [Histoplasma capsulatum H143]
MDPFSIAQLILLSGEIISACYIYGCAVSHAPEDLRKLVEETTSLSGIFVAIQGLVNADRFAATQKEALSNSLKECQVTLRQLKDILQSIHPGPDEKKMKVLKRFLWPLKQNETTKILESLGRHKSSLNLLLALEATLEAQQTQIVLYELQQALQDDREERKGREIMERRIQVNQWLCGINFTTTHDRASSEHSSGTGAWVLNSEQLQCWLFEGHSLLWIHGIPGSGKTVLMSTILNQCLLSSASEKNIIAYYYCDFRSHDSCRPESVIGAIILQICQVLNFLPEHVEDSYTRHIGKDGKAAAPSFQELEVLLSETLALVPNVTIAVDALDECHERESLIKIMSDLPSNASASVKVLVSSRREVDIVRLLKDHPSISTQCQDADEDIHHYIRASIKLRPRLQKLNQALQEHIVETLTKGAGGMFRWVKCQLDELARLRTDGAIKSALCGLPRDLDETYERILGRISEHDIPLARQALLWLAYASRPLTLSELAEGAIIQPNITTLDPEDRLHDPEDILEVCGSLVSLDGPYVVLAHNSVRDYLLSSCAANSLPRFYLPECHCLPELSTLCLTYLMLSQFSTGPCVTSEDMIQRLKDWPLLQYISHNWADHARPYLNPSQNPTLYIQATTLFADPPTANFLSWVQILFVNPRRLQKTYNLYPRTGTPLYYATSFALTSVFEHLLAQGSDVNAQGGRGGGTPLHAACWRVQVELIRLLLRSGANLDVRDKNGETAVDLAESAMAAGNVEIAGVFLEERGIVLNNQNGRDAGDWWDNVNGNIRKYRLKWKPRVIR